MQSSKTYLFISILIMSYCSKIQRYSDSDPILLQTKQIKAYSINGICFINSNSTILNLNPLYSSDVDYVMNTPDGNQLVMNFCNTPRYSCNNSRGLFSYRSNTTCYTLSGPSLFSTYFLNYNSKNKTMNFTVTLPPGDVCMSDPNQRYQIILSYQCTSDTSSLIISTTQFNITKCLNIIPIVAYPGCLQTNIYGLYLALQRNSIFCCIFFILIGGFLVSVGKKYVVITHYAAGVSLLIYIFIWVILNSVSLGISDMVLLGLIGVCLCGGAAVGFFISKIEIATPLIFSSLGGYVLSIIAYQVFLKSLSGTPMYIYYISIVGGLIFGVLFGLGLNLYIILVGMNLTGAFLIVKAVGIFAGNYPDERQIYDLITYSEISQLNNMSSITIYGYIIGIIFIAGLGTFGQYKFFTSEEEKKNGKLDFSKPNASIEKDAEDINKTGDVKDPEPPSAQAEESQKLIKND